MDPPWGLHWGDDVACPHPGAEPSHLYHSITTWAKAHMTQQPYRKTHRKTHNNNNNNNVNSIICNQNSTMVLSAPMISIDFLFFICQVSPPPLEGGMGKAGGGGVAFGFGRLPARGPGQAPVHTRIKAWACTNILVGLRFEQP